MSCITKLVLRHDYAFVAMCISTIVIKVIHSIVNINNSLNVNNCLSCFSRTSKYTRNYLQLKTLC